MLPFFAGKIFSISFFISLDFYLQVLLVSIEFYLQIFILPFGRGEVSTGREILSFIQKR